MTAPEPITITWNDTRLRGALYQAPDARGTVLLNHGYSANRTGTTRSFAQLAQHLLSAGFSVIAYDRLGQGESPGELADVTLDGEISQIETMIAAHSADQPLHVLGHSLGGMATAKAAAALPDKVASVTLWAPAAFVSDEIASGRVLGKSITPILGGDLVDHEGQGIGASMIASARGFDPYEGLERYNGPAHLHHCEGDDVIPMRYAERYVEIWGTKTTLHRYPDGDHGFSSLPIRKVMFAETVAGIRAAAGQQ